VTVDVGLNCFFDQQQGEKEGETEGEKEEEEEEEEADIVMCLWVDKPGMGGGVGGTSSQSSPRISDVRATVMLQEVLPGVSGHHDLHAQIAQSTEYQVVPDRPGCLQVEENVA